MDIGVASNIAVSVTTVQRLYHGAVSWGNAQTVAHADCKAIQRRKLAKSRFKTCLKGRPVDLWFGHDTVLECFDRSSGSPVVIPKLRNKAYLSAKALLHLAIQRKCIGDESDKAVFKSISSRHPIMGSKHYEGDSDLESTLCIIDRVLGDSQPIHWQNFSFSVQHHAWMGHILLYRAWDVVRKHKPLPDDIKEFVLHSLRLEPPPPAPIVAGCLLIIGLLLGIKLHIDDLLVVDERYVEFVRRLSRTKLNLFLQSRTQPSNWQDLRQARGDIQERNSGSRGHRPCSGSNGADRPPL